MNDRDLLSAGLAHRTRHNSGLITRAVKRGHLMRLLPGVYCAAGEPPGLDLRAAAVMHKDPGAVVLGAGAAALGWWPDLAVHDLLVARTGAPEPAPMFRWTQAMPPPEHIVSYHGIRLTDPPLTVLDLVPELGGEPIDQALRRRVATLGDLWGALRNTPNRPANKLRRRLLLDSADEPWSEAERRFHQLLRAMRLPWRYRTNHEIRTSLGRCFVDVGLGQLKLAFEVDGYSYHSAPRTFAADRTRDLGLALAGWEVHHIAAVTVTDEPSFVTEAVSQLAHRRAKLLGLTPPRGGQCARPVTSEWPGSTLLG
nr:hypothetical protein [Propionibacterium sp.]